MMAGLFSFDTAQHNEIHMSHSYDCTGAYITARLDIVNLLLWRADLRTRQGVAQQ